MTKEECKKYIGKLCHIILEDGGFIGIIEEIEEENGEDWIMLDEGYAIRVKAIKKISILDDRGLQ